MKNKIIESILKAEKETEKMYSSAKTESLKIVSKAEEDNIKIKNNAQESSKKMLKEQTLLNEEKFKKQFDEALLEYVKQAEELEKNAQKNYDKAINVIFKKIEKAK